MERSGLRVSECAALEKRDFKLEDGVLKLDVRTAKGGSVDTVRTIEDPWLAAKLQEVLEPLGADDKPFYSASTMKNKAAKYGIECHDFRRIAANEYRDGLLDEGVARADANTATQGFLRHSRFSTTKRYLTNRRLSFSKNSQKKSSENSQNPLTECENDDIIETGSEANEVITTERGARDVSGYRQSRHIILDEADIERLNGEIEAIGADKSVFRFNEGNKTGFDDDNDCVNVRGDVFPDLQSTHPRDKMSERAVFAHEYYGHYEFYPSKFKPSDWRDEFRASYIAAIKAPNLSVEDRAYLMLDAYERAKEAGCPLELSKKAREIIYGYSE